MSDEMRYIGKPGKYYIGDLCYVIDGERWKEVCALIGHGSGGEFVLADGTPFAIYKTKTGDGTYPLVGLESRTGFDSRTGHMVEGKADPRAWLPVDSGTIGCIALNACNGDGIESGSTQEFIAFFETGRNPGAGTIYFGDLWVETGDGKETYMDDGYDEYDEDDA